MANALTDPPFAADPPIKLNVNAKVLGLVIGILAVIGAIFGLLGFLGSLALLSAVSTFCGVTACGSTGIFFLALIGFLAVLVGDIFAAIGGFQMYNLNRLGKNKVIYGLALTVLGAILEVIGYSAGFVFSLIFNIIVAAVVYYMVVISRFPGEAPLVTTGAGYGGYGGPGGTPPPPPPGPTV